MKFPSLNAVKIVISTTFTAASDENSIKMMGIIPYIFTVTHHSIMDVPIWVKTIYIIDFRISIIRNYDCP